MSIRVLIVDHHEQIRRLVRAFFLIETRKTKLDRHTGFVRGLRLNYMKVLDFRQARNHQERFIANGFYRGLNRW
jgi:hypothetical protein